MDYERTASTDAEVASCDNLSSAQDVFAQTHVIAQTNAEPETTSEASNPFDAVPAVLRRALEGRGFTELSAVQSAVLATDAEGRDLQISSQTGSGKTVALGLVVTERLQQQREGNGAGPQVLIIVPTRELANQVSDELSWLFADVPGVRVSSVTGGTPLFRERKMLARKPRVLVGTPGRLLDHVSTGVLDLRSVSELVLDEADQMLDMGFREELEGILEKTPESRRTHLVSATFPEGIQRLAKRYQNTPVMIEGTRLGDANQDITHEGHLVHPNDRYDSLINLLLLAGEERTLVFVERRSDATELSERLDADGFSALPLSGELAQSQRERTVHAFRSGRANVLVATDVAARGLDVPNVATVIHTAPPLDAQIYTHRSGRTGRAGNSGKSILFAPPSKRWKVDRLTKDAGVDFRWRPIPNAKTVLEELEKRNRVALEKSMATDLEAGASERHLATADELLEGREAKDVIAVLLARLEPKRRAQPRNIHNHMPPPNKKGRGQRPGGREYGRNDRYDRNAPRQNYGRNDRFDRSSKFDRDERQGGYNQDRGGYSQDRGNYSRGRDNYGQDGPRRGRPERGATVRFFANWGVNQGANPSRVLAVVCRRGDVNGGDIGSIAVHPNATTFDVASDVAERFERNAAQRDPRTPQVWIRRDRGPQQQGGGKKPYKKKSYGPRS